MKTTRSFFNILYIGILAVILVISGCSSSNNKANEVTPTNANAGSGNAATPTASAGTGNTNATITMATVADPNFNPWSPTGFVESEPITELLFSGLTKWGLDYQPAPSLATDWTPSEDGLTWIINLRDDVKWSDGEAFTADDVVYTFNKIVLNKDLGAANSSNFVAVKEVTKVSDTQVKFVLTQPWSSLPNYLAWFAKILPEHIFAGHDNPWELTSFNKENPVGTGAYVLAKYSPGQSVELERNPDFFEGKANIAKIVFQIVPDMNSQVAQMMSGSLSLLTVEDPNLLDKLKANANLTVSEVSDNNYYWAAVNQRQDRFKDVKVRQALLYAIDRDAIITGVLKGYGKPATGPIAPLQEKYYDSNVKTYEYDPAKAKELLKEAGYEEGSDGFMQKDGKVFELNMPAGQYGVLLQTSQLVQQYWEAIGIKVDLKVMDWNTYVEKVVQNHEFDATIAWWRAPVDPDVLAYYHSNAVDKGNNIPGYSNPAMDKLLEDGRKASTDEERVKIYNQVQELTAEELPYLYLWNPNIAIATQKSLVVPPASIAVAENHVTEWTVQE
ncbi:ABC transporter substrate-binding protein [Paenibacillus sp. 19GGS1-52]|uniref:ABC transporter substrate-binding protein n=1 Tax=Paenibacillus sp. 19GGS1-52 TaxID=2758563 RepID=UPI001EFB51DF|nr:ABC transporter substrate-binding protein [Paenibacillus sp. 19GGS1-52]ULO09057.1 ABC transporter substrate-binding protein [Paenibacillus sp. 19GGS1-52]